MKMLQNIFTLTMVICCLSFTCIHLSGFDAYAGVNPLKTEPATVGEIKGMFSVILYGGSYTDDLETVALLDIDGDQYIFEPFAPEFDYVIKKGLSAEEAVAAAEKFVKFHSSFWKIKLSKIIDSEGKILGFEVKPLYFPFFHGTSDLLDIYYWPQKGGKIKVTIKLIPSVERLKFHPEGGGGL
jgi:hypothetical protein